jgi:cytochrome oxidase Cu insertion factor (SCO1/SenC/PrrC family)
MKILLDECLDWRLARDIVGHQVSSVRDMRWIGLKNGDLLARAAEQFEVFVTVDRNLAFQNELDRHSVAVIVLNPRTNRLRDLQTLVPQLLELLPKIRPRTVVALRAD